MISKDCVLFSSLSSVEEMFKNCRETGLTERTGHEIESCQVGIKRNGNV